MDGCVAVAVAEAEAVVVAVGEAENVAVLLGISIAFDVVVRTLAILLIGEISVNVLISSRTYSLGARYPAAELSPTVRAFTSSASIASLPFLR